MCYSDKLNLTRAIVKTKLTNFPEVMFCFDLCDCEELTPSQFGIFFDKIVESFD